MRWRCPLRDTKRIPKALLCVPAGYSERMTDASEIPVVPHPDRGAVVVAPQGDVDMSRSPTLRATLQGVHEKRPRLLVVDLEGVSYMDSSGLATLVESMRTAKGHGTEMVLCGMNDKVRAIFEIARLHHFFTIVDTREQALAD